MIKVYIEFSIYEKDNVISENPNNVSLGIGNMEKENQKLKDTYYYKYSKVNNEYPTEKNEFFISKDSYLIEKDLQQKDTYTQKLKWIGSEWNFNSLEQGKYPLIKNIEVEQEGIKIPTDPDTDDNVQKNISTIYEGDEINTKLSEKQQNLFE